MLELGRNPSAPFAVIDLASALYFVIAPTIIL